MLAFALIILVMGMVGLVFGIVLALANKKLAVERNPLIHVVEDILPKGQCGACGFAGCQAYAEAVVNDPDVAPDLCIPGKAEVANKVAELTGKKAAEMAPRVAHVKCANPISSALKKYSYSGIEDCVAASLLQLGPKSCEYGCIGFGTCERSCAFGAITLNEDGLPIIDLRKCVGCGKCASACPKRIIEMVPLMGTMVEVNCSSKDKGAVARKHCPVACLGCGLCVKLCPYGAIKVESNLAIVDSSVCMAKCDKPVCLDKCPTKAIKASANFKKRPASCEACDKGLPKP